MNNIKKIQEKLIEKNLDAVLVTDEKNQRYATGFPFTDGAVIVARSDPGRAQGSGRGAPRRRGGEAEPRRVSRL